MSTGMFPPLFLEGFSGQPWQRDLRLRGAAGHVGRVGGPGKGGSGSVSLAFLARWLRRGSARAGGAPGSRGGPGPSEGTDGCSFGAVVGPLGRPPRLLR